MGSSRYWNDTHHVARVNAEEELEVKGGLSTCSSFGIIAVLLTLRIPGPMLF